MRIGNSRNHCADTISLHFSLGTFACCWYRFNTSTETTGPRMSDRRGQESQDVSTIHVSSHHQTSLLCLLLCQTVQVQILAPESSKKSVVFFNFQISTSSGPQAPIQSISVRANQKSVSVLLICLPFHACIGCKSACTLPSLCNACVRASLGSPTCDRASSSV